MRLRELRRIPTALLSMRCSTRCSPNMGTALLASYFEELTLEYDPTWSIPATASMDRSVLELGMLHNVLYVELWKLLDAVPPSTEKATVALVGVGTSSQEAFARLAPVEDVAILDRIRGREYSSW